MSGKAAPKAEEKKPKAPKLEFPEEPAKPDQETFQKAKADFEGDIDKLKKELDGFTQQINGKQEGKEEYEAQKQTYQLDFEKAKEYFDSLREQQTECLSKLKDQNETRRNNMRDLRDLKKTVDEVGEEGIDRRIKELEFKMHTTTMKLQEEKMIIKEIQDLKRKRPEMAKMAQRLEELEQNQEVSDLSKKPLQEQLDEIRSKIEHAKAVKDEKNTILKELRDSRKDQREAIQALIGSKEEIKDKINKKRDAIRDLRDNYKKEEKNHQHWLYQCRDIRRQARDAQWQKECEAWEAEEKKRELEHQNEKPYFEEMTLLEQTIQYCAGLIKSDDKKETAEVKTAFEAPEGCVVMLTKKEREAEGAMLAAKAKKGKKAKAAKTNNNIKHNAATFSLFTQLKVKAPMTLDDVPEAVKELNVKLEVYNEKIREWQANRDRLQQEVDAAASKINEEAEEA